MFKNLYAGELKKMFSLKTALIMLAIFVFGFIVITLSFNAIDNLSTVENGMPQQAIHEGNRINVSKEDAKSMIAFFNEQLDRLEKEKKEKGFTYYMSLLNPGDQIYQLKSQIAIYEYIEDNNLYNTDLYFYDTTMYSLSGINSRNATPYAVLMISIFSFLLSVYALIIGSGAFATEMRSGTLKILLLKPITRNQLTLAKLLSVLTILAGAVMTVFLLIIIYSYIAYDNPSGTMYFIFNASKVFKAANSFPLFLAWLQLFVSTLAMGIMAFFFGAITRKRVLGFVLPYAIDLAAPLIGMVGLARFWISNTISISGFFGFGTGLAAGSNFFISLPFAIAYIGAMIALSFIIFNRRDVA